MRKPIVLQILPSMNQGGVEHAMFEMAQAMAERFGESYVASNGGELLKRTHQFVHIQLPLHSKNPLSIFINAFRLRRVIYTHRINIVHARSRAPAWSAWLACKMTKIPFVTTYHAAYKGKSFLKKLYNSVMTRGRTVIAPSRYIAHHVQREYPKAAVHLIYEGIDTGFYAPSICAAKLSEKIIFLPSRLSPIKGIDIALRSLCEVVKAYPDVKLMLIRTGKPHYMKEIDGLIEHLYLTQHVVFIPPTSDLRPYYQKALIVLMTSIVPEALGRISLEALAMHCLLIATDIGANSEICIDQETGFLAPPGDIQKLALLIKYCVNLEDESKNALYKRGRQHIEDHFSVHAMYQKTIDLYSSLL